MAYKPSKIKRGMGGSRNGKSRWEKTEVLKEQSKTLRREEDKAAVKEQREAGYEGTAEASGRVHTL